MRAKQDHVKKGFGRLRISNVHVKGGRAVMGMKRSMDSSKKTLMNSTAAAKHQHEEYEEGKLISKKKKGIDEEYLSIPKTQAIFKIEILSIQEEEQRLQPQGFKSLETS
ncbi:hypothetical protein Tco_0750765 [Tanacetum coccineum]|uniref:Uncharacterized protein n=1 Tax=Tanacetum coccineum TaxID=301880 RepID=A0ABQ4Z262_9ASTR